MHDLSAQQPRLPHSVRNVQQTPERAGGYEVVIVHNEREYVAPYGATVTKAIANAELFIIEKFPAYIL
jgi:hypothetical protein